MAASQQGCDPPTQDESTGRGDDGNIVNQDKASSSTLERHFTEESEPRACPFTQDPYRPLPGDAASQETDGTGQGNGVEGRRDGVPTHGCTRGWPQAWT